MPSLVITSELKWKVMAPVLTCYALLVIMTHIYIGSIPAGLQMIVRTLVNASENEWWHPPNFSDDSSEF